MTEHPEILTEIIQKAGSHELRHFDLSNKAMPASFILCYMLRRHGARSLRMMI